MRGRCVRRGFGLEVLGRGWEVGVEGDGETRVLCGVGIGVSRVRWVVGTGGVRWVEGVWRVRGWVGGGGEKGRLGFGVRELRR